MDERTNGDCGQGQCIAGLDVCISAGYYRFANLEALGLKDVALFTVCIVQKSDASTAIGVVLDRGNLGGDTVLVALEVDDAVTTLVAATLMTRSDTAIVVAASLLGQGRQQGLLGRSAGDLSKVRDSLEAASRARGLELFYSHFLPFYGYELRVRTLGLMWTPSPPWGPLGDSPRRFRVSTRPGVSINSQTQPKSILIAYVMRKR